MAGKRKVNNYSEWPKPIFSEIIKTNKNYKKVLHDALMYTHYHLSSDDLKKEVVKYLKNIDPKHPLIERMKPLNDGRFSTVGKYMYVLNFGGQVPDDISSGLMSSLEKTINEEEENKASKGTGSTQVATTDGEIKPPRMVISIQDRLRDKANTVSCDVEGWLDDFFMDKKLPTKTVEEFVNLFKSFELKAPHMRYMYNIFDKRAEEVAEAVKGKDKDLNEGYSFFTKPELNKLDQFYKNLLKACAMMQEVAKVERAPRKKKPISQEKLVAKLKYKKEDNTLGIVSTNPVYIIGSKEVWIYNTKNRKLAQYKAIDEQGLSVKGASLVNYSSDSAEKTLRKPADALSEFKKASKVKLRTFLKDLSTLDTTCNGKLNEHCVILRVDK